MRIRFTRGAREHRIGKAHAWYVIGTAIPEIAYGDGNEGGDAIRWVGLDDRGVELEIIGIVLPEEYLVIHVMPTGLRAKGRGGHG